MNTRRKFFGQLATMLAGVVAPSILLPRQLDKFTWNGQRMAVKKVTSIWTCELEQDLQSYHHINAEAEILDQLSDMNPEFLIRMATAKIDLGLYKRWTI